MNNVAATIEDLLEILAGLKSKPTIKIESNDATIMHSIARQTFRGTALTDRQFNLMQEKLQTYRNQFMDLGHNFDMCIDSLRQPLRQIDRSKFIKLVKTVDVFQDKVYESEKSDWMWVQVRFPFSKTLIMKINNIRAVRDYVHHKGEHSHYFKFNERNVKCIVEAFLNSNFEIEKDILDYYEKIKLIENSSEDYIPFIKDYQLVNVNHNAKKLIASEIGEVNQDNILQLIDRRNRYGVTKFTYTNKKGSLQETIALRENRDILFKPNEYKLNDILFALNDLDRYPLLFILDEIHAEKQLHQVFNFYKDFIPAEQQSVLFRLEGSDQEFNHLVKDYKINNWVDKSTKIVYTSVNKIPKVLFKADWQPIATVSFNSKTNRNLDLYTKTHCDLIIFYDNEISPLRRYSSYYA